MSKTDSSTEEKILSSSNENHATTKKTSSVPNLFLHVTLVLATLLSFPSILPQVIGFWLLLYLVQAIQEKATFFPIAMALFTLCIKGSFYNLPPIFFGGCIAAGLVIHLLSLLIQHRKFVQILCSIVLLLCTSFFWIHYTLSASSSYKITFDQMGPIVCLGDSLTASGYPKDLQKLTQYRIIDKGINGIETSEGLKEIPEIVKYDPSFVVIELGGHDYNNGKSRSETKRNLERIIDRLQYHEIEVILVEIPRGLVYDPFRGIEREVAEKFDLELISDSTIRTFVFFGPSAPPGILLPTSWRRSKDGIHPNKNGNEVFAKEVNQAINRVLGR